MAGLREREEFKIGGRVSLSQTLFQDLCTGLVPDRYPFLAAPEEVEVASASAEDATGGIGAQTVELNMLKEDFDSTTLFVELDGTTPVVVPDGPWFRCNGMRVATAGASGFATGPIDLISAGGSEMAHIEGGEAASNSGFCIFTVPKDEAIRFHSFYVRVGKSNTKMDELVGLLEVRPFGEVFGIQMSTPLTSREDNPSVVSLNRLRLGVGADIRISARAGSINMDAYGVLAYRREQRTGVL